MLGGECEENRGNKRESFEVQRILFHLQREKLLKLLLDAFFYSLYINCIS